MAKYSSAEAAKKLGLSPSGLSKYIRLGKVPGPDSVKTGSFVIHAWTDEDIEQVRKLLPKIANGRKTRYQKLREKQTQAGAPVLQKKRKTKKKK